MSASDVGRALKGLRKRSGLSTAALARAIDRPTSTYASYENTYKKRWLPVDLARELANKLAGLGEPPISKEEVFKLAGMNVITEPASGMFVLEPTEPAEKEGHHGPYHHSNVTLAPDAPPFPDVFSMPLDVPVFGTAEGGPDGAFELNYLGGPIGWARRPPALRGIREVFAIYVEGTSMEPWRKRGDVTYIHKTRGSRAGDHVVIVQDNPVRGQPPRAFIKRLIRRSDDVLEAEQYNPRQPMMFDNRAIKEVLRVLEWPEVMGF